MSSPSCFLFQGPDPSKVLGWHSFEEGSPGNHDAMILLQEGEGEKQAAPRVGSPLSPSPRKEGLGTGCSAGRQEDESLSSTRVDTSAEASKAPLTFPVRCWLPLSEPSLEPAYMHIHDRGPGLSGQARTQTPCPAQNRGPKGWNYCPAFRKGAI